LVIHKNLGKEVFKMIFDLLFFPVKMPVFFCSVLSNFSAFGRIFFRKTSSTPIFEKECLFLKKSAYF